MSYFQTITTQPCPNLDLVRQFFRDHGTALSRAAHKLGGPVASGCVFLLGEALHHTSRLTMSQNRQLVNFHRLLTLEHVSDPERIESGLFSDIEPDSASAFADECCVLSENLGALLLQIVKNECTRDLHCEASPMIPQVA